VSGIARRWRFILAVLKRLPQGLVSRLVGRLAELRLPGSIQGFLNRGFARAVGVDLTEAERPPEAYPSLSEFFVRRLRPGVRAWPADPQAPTSPVDGIVGEVGRVREGRLIQAKGLDYSVEDLLADAAGAHLFTDGTFVTIYLSPRHYHRIHSPVSGSLTAACAVPGRLLPVNDPAVRSVPHLFPRNERLVALLTSVWGPVAIVAVGAFNVGRISAAFDAEWNGADHRGVTNRPGARGTGLRRYDPGLPVARGEELMTFHLGSTVVLLFSEGAGKSGTLSAELRPGAAVTLGQPLFEPEPVLETPE
jgi:phosphatidylserine decarboxylase